MASHAIHGVAIRDAVARGDVGEARAAARRLAEGRDAPDTAPEPAMEPELEAMTIAARRVSDARDLDESAHRLGALAETCGACHAQFEGPRALVTEPPPESRHVAGRMARHQWAAARLWEGLVAPSSDAWARGARVLEDAPLEPERLTPGKSPVPKVGALATAVHDLGRKAAVADSSARRAEVYGELMATCGGCHAWLGGGP
jgi:cytochrome c553